MHVANREQNAFIAVHRRVHGMCMRVSTTSAR
jgi:hypothetical protein